ncbi:MAG: LysR family transcriptional regulator, partial [Chloroflexota bacterium]
ELHQLEYFVAVVEAGTFSKAAKRCNITQPSLSQQIINLETEIGRKLFNRLGRRITITEAGELLYPRACAILSDVQHAKHALTDGYMPGNSTLSVGIIPTLGSFLLYETVTQFQSAYPNATLHIHEDMTDNLIAKLMTAELDIAFVSLPIANNQLAITPLIEEPLYIAMPQDHGLASASEIMINDLTNIPFIRLSDHDCLSDQLDNFCYVQKINPPTIYQTSHLSTVMELVRLGMGISLVPACAVQGYANKDIVFRQLSNPLARTIVSARHKGREQTTLNTACSQYLQQAWRTLTTTNPEAK